NLLLARATARNKELAVRKVLGASRTRLVRQLVSESLLLSSIGGILGVFLAFVVMPLIRSVAPGRIPRLAESQVNGTVLLFSVVLSGFTGLLFGLAPAFQIAGKQIEES